MQNKCQTILSENFVKAEQTRHRRVTAAQFEFQRLLDTMQLLKKLSPWVRAQTMQTLRKFTLEEAHELIDAIDSGDVDEVRAEIGDLLYHAAFYSAAVPFNIDDSLRGIVAKVQRRHAHIDFERGSLVDGIEGELTPQLETEMWERVKEAERARSTAPDTERDALAGLPRTPSSAAGSLRQLRDRRRGSATSQHAEVRSRSHGCKLKTPRIKRGDAGL